MKIEVRCLYSCALWKLPQTEDAVKKQGGIPMKQSCRKALTFLLTLLLLFSTSISAVAANASLQPAVDGSAAYLLDTVKAPQVGSIGGEWAVLGLARSGYAVPQTYWNNYYSTVEDYVKGCQSALHDNKYTEYSRVIVALTAIGANPANVAGYNLLTPLGDFDKVVWQGINGPIWALIALDAGSYEMPMNSSAQTQATRQLYVDDILARALADGGWNLTDKGGAGIADADITGMALQALAKYQEQPAVKTATDNALVRLSAMQNSDGGYSSWGTANSESVVQVLVALGELGISVDDSRFVKSGHTLLTNLLTYRQTDGSFLHTGSGTASNQMASEQGFYGLVSALRAQNGQPSLYRMTDVTISVSGASTSVAGLPGKNDDVKQTQLTAPGTTFPDIAAHKNQTAIEALASRGIINGKETGLFEPNDNMTRAEFATIAVKALGLPAKTGGTFTDVNPLAWHAGYVGTATAYGIANGVGDGRFDPDGTITRQEAAVMTARAAQLCGMDTQMTDTAARDLLAQFGDYTTAADWAKQSLAFCYQTSILAQSDLNIEPHRAILRGEVAQMLYQLLLAAKLL